MGLGMRILDWHSFRHVEDTGELDEVLAISYAGKRRKQYDAHAPRTLCRRLPSCLHCTCISGNRSRCCRHLYWGARRLQSRDSGTSDGQESLAHLSLNTSEGCQGSQGRSIPHVAEQKNVQHTEKSTGLVRDH